jgi:multiple sugar transport system permease protein
VYRLAFSSEIGMPRLGYASAASITFGLSVIFLTIFLQGLKKLFTLKKHGKVRDEQI